MIVRIINNFFVPAANSRGLGPQKMNSISDLVSYTEAFRLDQTEARTDTG